MEPEEEMGEEPMGEELMAEDSGCEGRRIWLLRPRVSPQEGKRRLQLPAGERPAAAPNSKNSTLI